MQTQLKKRDRKLKIALKEEEERMRMREERRLFSPNAITVEAIINTERRIINKDDLKVNTCG